MEVVALLLPCMMVVVIDTNVFVSACLGTGAAGVIIARCLRGKLKPLMGAALFAEYEDVLGRDSLFVKSRLDRFERDELLEIFLSTCRWTNAINLTKTLSISQQYHIVTSLSQHPSQAKYAH